MAAVLVCMINNFNTCTCVAGYLCKLNANTYGIDFLEFEVKNTDTGKTLFKARRLLETVLSLLSAKKARISPTTH